MTISSVNKIPLVWYTILSFPVTSDRLFNIKPISFLTVGSPPVTITFWGLISFTFGITCLSISSYDNSLSVFTNGLDFIEQN